jgi:PIN domain
LPEAFLYIETNFMISHATGRDRATDELLLGPSPSVKLVLPSVRFMEAFSAFEDERKRHNRLVGDFEKQIQQLKRNVISARIEPLIDHLDRAVVELRAVFNDYQARLFAAIDRLRTLAEVIHPTPEIVAESLSRALIDDPTDNLILASILTHAAAHPHVVKTFLSENWKDFESKPYPKSAIELAGVKYFRSPSKFLEWHQARPESIE